MEIYNFKCKNCGSTKYVKVSDNIFECPYCGYREEILMPEKKPEPEQIEIVEPEISEPQKPIAPPVETEEKTNETKKKCLSELKAAILKFILVLFIGYLGIQHFIEGRILLGLVYVCTFGFFGLGWGVDVIIYFFRLLSATSNYLGA